LTQSQTLSFTKLAKWRATNHRKHADTKWMGVVQRNASSINTA